MAALGYDVLQARIGALANARAIGRVIEIGKGIVKVSGLSDVVSLGDLVEVRTSSGDVRMAEVMQLTNDHIIIFPDGPGTGLQVGNMARHLGNGDLAPDVSWIGRIVDSFGNPLDDLPIMPGPVARPVLGKILNASNRRALGPRMETGLAVFNTFLPIVRGQRIGLFAGSGVGKSTLLAKLALGLDADVVVIAMIGERSREVREFVEKVLGPAGMKKAVVVAATSDCSSLTRRRCAHTAMTVAEHFRDLGRQVLFVADSITRFAEAHRETALSIGEPATLRGYPPSTAHAITSLCERAGPGQSDAGDITAVFTVLVAGSDMEEPVADIMRGVLDGHVVLDREIAERGRFPAIDLLRSVSRSLPQAATDAENQVIAKARMLLGAYENSEVMVRAGLYTVGSDPLLDKAIECWPAIDQFIAQSERDDTTSSFEKLVACLAENAVPETQTKV